MHKIGIDLGGTKIEGILLDEKYNTIQRKRIETYQENGYDSIVKSIISLINELKAKTDEETSVGICTPGVTDANSGLIKNSNTQCLIGMPLKNNIENELGHEIIMENDANCFALAESLLGSGKGHDVVFGVIMGTGVGGGIVINIFTKFSKENGPFTYLAQGTLYPDVIESGVSKGPASVIKTHHNVGGLPDWLHLKVLEPLRDLYKDEVRKIAKIIGVPQNLLMRHPFPGPGLAVRIIGEVTKNKLDITRVASKIVEEELQNANLYDKVWQAYAAVGDDKAVGVVGDERKYGNIVMIRIIDSVDAMTADWTRLPNELLEKISNRITNEIDEVTWVSYVVSSKPPATIEPQ